MLIQFSRPLSFGNVTSDLRETLNEAVLETILVVEQDAKDRCPVDTGFLRDSIHAELDGDSSSLDIVTGIIQVDADYAEYVHDGTVKKGPNPFLRIAMDDNEGVFEDYVARAINKALEK